MLPFKVKCAFFVPISVVIDMGVNGNAEIIGMRNSKNCLQKMKQPYYNKFVHKICGINVRRFKSHKESEYLVILTISQEKYKN
ncbi:hypothetical protein DXB97_00350 [Firmicutes bacterium OM07-11]|nr:hypothetical protein DW901_04305 [Firmicutes bacterium AM41-5BH]RHV08538.1 hypothetical protein DXB97_00350 [Firmicutes bacterium OM07-11]RKQ31039.1 hypothetical protein D8Q48_03355 [Ruminococcus sp. B05]